MGKLDLSDGIKLEDVRLRARGCRPRDALDFRCTGWVLGGEANVAEGQREIVSKGGEGERRTEAAARRSKGRMHQGGWSTRRRAQKRHRPATKPTDEGGRKRRPNRVGWGRI